MHVYIAENATGIIKIGIADDPSIREDTLYVDGVRSRMLVSCKFDRQEARRIEKQLHERFSAFAVPGMSEWFFPFPTLRQLIEELGGQLTFAEPPRWPSKSRKRAA